VERRESGSADDNPACRWKRTLRDSAINMTTATAFAPELLHLPRGRKRTVLRIELLHNINLGNTATLRILRGYLVAALWSSIDDEGNPLDRDFEITSISTESLLSAWAECSRFIRENETDLTHLDDERNGHNFWLTRNRHGSGFWNERVDDESAEFAMQQLTHASQSFGEIDLYIGDDKKLHFTNEADIA
jgi:hypothetical protein